jgi:hypothetical protein
MELTVAEELYRIVRDRWLTIDCRRFSFVDYRFRHTHRLNRNCFDN